MQSPLRALGPTAAVVLAGLSVTTRAEACRTNTCMADATCTLDDRGCMVGGSPVYWEQPCVSFSVDSRGVPRLGLDFTSTEQLVTTAFSLWPNTDCGGGYPSIAVMSLGPLSCHAPEFNRGGPNANAVILYESDWPHDATQLGLTTVTYDVDTGKIFDADMEVNLESYQLTPNELQYIVAHEAGHFLGLAHSPNFDSLMYLQYSPFGASAAPVLTPDDTESICSAYPPNRSVGECDFEPEHGYAADCGGDVVSSCQVDMHRSQRTRGAPFALALALIIGSVRLGRAWSKRA